MSDASFFRTLWPEARLQMDGVFGESVTLMPRARKAGDANARSAVDPNRPAIIVLGIWDDTPSDTFPQSRDLPEKNAHQVNDGDIVLTIAKARLPYTPAQGDLVKRLLTGETFSVATVQDNAETEWVINLTSRGA